MPSGSSRPAPFDRLLGKREVSLPPDLSEIKGSLVVGRRPNTPRRWPRVRHQSPVPCGVALAQSPWEQAAANLETSFTGPPARSLAEFAAVSRSLSTADVIALTAA